MIINNLLKSEIFAIRSWVLHTLCLWRFSTATGPFCITPIQSAAAPPYDDKVTPPATEHQEDFLSKVKQFMVATMKWSDMEPVD